MDWDDDIYEVTEADEIRWRQEALAGKPNTRPVLRALGFTETEIDTMAVIGETR